MLMDQRTTTRRAEETDSKVIQEAPAGVKRYNLALPEELFSQIQALADRQHTSVLEILKRFIKLGLLAAKLEEDPNAALIIREGNVEREIVFL